jgi:TolA-binding protein
MPIDSKSEHDKELADIKKEVIEARNLVIKTDNLLKSFHSELKAVAKQNEEFARKQWVSSAVAYVLFAALVVGGAFLVSSASTRSTESERERLEKQVAELTSQLEAQKKEVAATTQARQSAADVYRMLTTLPGDERLKGVDALVKLDTARLSALERTALTDRAELLRKEVGDVAFERGKSAFRRNDMATTAEQLSRFMAMNPAPGDAREAAFFLGVAYNQLRKYEQAIPMLQRFVDEEKRSKNRDYAMLLLAHSLEQTNQLDKAADVARDALGTYPNSEFAPQLRARLASVKRQQAGTAAPATVPTAPIAAPGQAPAATTAAPAGQSQ